MALDVVPEDLRTASRDIADDAAEVTGGCTDAASGAITAQGGVNGGPLTGALADLVAAVDEVASATGAAVAQAGTTLSGNADQYEADDAAAARRLEACVPEEQGPPVLPPPSGRVDRRPDPWNPQPVIPWMPYGDRAPARGAAAS